MDFLGVDDYEEYAGVVRRGFTRMRIGLVGAIGEIFRCAQDDGIWCLFIVGGYELAVFDVHFLNIVGQFEFLAIFGRIHEALHS